MASIDVFLFTDIPNREWMVSVLKLSSCHLADDMTIRSQNLLPTSQICPATLPGIYFDSTRTVFSEYNPPVTMIIKKVCGRHQWQQAYDPIPRDIASFLGTDHQVRLWSVSVLNHLDVCFEFDRTKIVVFSVITAVPMLSSSSVNRRGLFSSVPEDKLMSFYCVVFP